MKALSGVDGAFLHLETPETPMHVASLHLFDLPAGYTGDFHADIKRQMRRRLHLAPVFTRKLAPMPLQFANPVWVEDDQVDLDYHVQRVTLPSPGTQAQLEDCVGRLHSRAARPQPPAVAHGRDRRPGSRARSAYYFKVHHAVLDGQAGVLLAQALFDLTPKPRAHPARRRAAAAEHPGPGRARRRRAEARRRPVHQAGAAPARRGEDARRPVRRRRRRQAEGQLGQNFSFGPKTPLNVPITGERGFAALSMPLDTLKQLAAAHEAKLNDIVLALCSGALRRYLAQHGGIPKKPLIAAMPISLREAGNTEYTTQATMSLVNLNTHIADPVKRLRAIRDAAGAVKALAQRATRRDPDRLPVHRRALAAARPGLAVRPLGHRRRDAADRQRRDLQRAGAAGAAVRGRRAHGRPTGRCRSSSTASG